MISCTRLRVVESQRQPQRALPQQERTEVRAALKKAMELMSASYNQTTLNLLTEKLEQGLADDLGITELAEKVQEVYEFSDLYRAETVARTETFRVANTATREAWTQSGVVHSYKWYTASDPDVCEFCEAMNGKTVDAGDSFLDKNDRVVGTDGGVMNADYDDVENPPLHVNCRCYMRPEKIGIASAENQTEEKAEPEVPKISVEEEVKKQVGAFKDQIRDELREEQQDGQQVDFHILKFYNKYYAKIEEEGT